MNRRHSSSIRRAFGALSLVFSSAGCLGGQTGTEGTGTTTKDPEVDTGGGSSCVAQATALTASELSPLGFSVESLLTVATGSRAASLAWSAVPPELSGFGPEQGTSSITIGVEVSSRGARFVHWTPRATGPDVGGCAPDEVQIDAQVAFATAGGALSERFQAVLHATRVEAVQLTLSLPLATLNGTFTVSPRAGVRTDALVLDATITADSTSGTLRGQLEQTAGMTQSVRFFTYACWPAGADVCLGL